ncbi:hypothetical protein ACQ3G6_09840 [Allorhizobium undicola]|uniref:hypothetical protein n=1 Tax=Allorhizobium undicola TaxID=78527 RepID=UPI0005693BC0|nr:hypothetical protein [Allorhizobium undicola]
MSSVDQMESWALERAHRIMVREGANLMQAAQWLDKKQTLRTSQQLREAIQQCLIEALTMGVVAEDVAGFGSHPQSPASH